MLSGSARQSQSARGLTLSEIKYIPQDVGVQQFTGQFLHDVRFILHPDEDDFEQTDLFRAIVAVLREPWAYGVFNFDALIPMASFLVSEGYISAVIAVVNRPCTILRVFRTRNGLAWYSKGNVTMWRGLRGAELPLFVEWMRLTMDRLDYIHQEYGNFGSVSDRDKLSFRDFCHEYDIDETKKHFKYLFSVSVISGLWDVPPVDLRPDTWFPAIEYECLPEQFRQRAREMIIPLCQKQIPALAELTPTQKAIRDRRRQFSQFRIQEATRSADVRASNPALLRQRQRQGDSS
jgi:hypothetical protein